MAKPEAAVPVKPWNTKVALIAGIREGFAELGPEAAAAVPRIRGLFLRRPSPILLNAGDADDWRFAFLRIGVALDSLPIVLSQNAQMVARIKERLRTRRRNNERQIEQTGELGRCK